MSSGPEYWAPLDACVLQDVRSLSVPHVASLIVHEATHARLWKAGIRYGALMRARVEAVCVAAELAFLDRIPDEDGLREYTRKKIGHPWWDAESHTRRTRAELAEFDAPRWVRRLYDWLTGAQPRPNAERQEHES